MWSFCPTCTPSCVCYPFSLAICCVFLTVKHLNFVCETFCSMTAETSCFTTYYKVFRGISVISEKTLKITQTNHKHDVFSHFFLSVWPHLFPFTQLNHSACLWKEDWHKTNLTGLMWKSEWMCDSVRGRVWPRASSHKGGYYYYYSAPHKISLHSNKQWEILKTSYNYS